MSTFKCCECGMISENTDGCIACLTHINEDGIVCEDCMTDEHVEEMGQREDEP